MTGPAWLILGISALTLVVMLTEIAESQSALASREKWIKRGRIAVVVILQAVSFWFAMFQYNDSVRQATQEARHIGDSAKSASVLSAQAKESLTKLKAAISDLRQLETQSGKTLERSGKTLDRTRRLVRTQDVVLRNSKRLLFPLSGLIYVSYGFSFHARDVVTPATLRALRKEMQANGVVHGAYYEDVPLSWMRPDLEQFIAAPLFLLMVDRYPRRFYGPLFEMRSGAVVVQARWADLAAFISDELPYEAWPVNTPTPPGSYVPSPVPTSAATVGSTSSPSDVTPRTPTSCATATCTTTPGRMAIAASAGASSTPTSVHVGYGDSTGYGATANSSDHVSSSFDNQGYDNSGYSSSAYDTGSGYDYGTSYGAGGDGGAWFSTQQHGRLTVDVGAHWVRLTEPWLTMDLQESVSNGKLVSLLDFARAEIVVVPTFYWTGYGTGDTEATARKRYEEILRDGRLNWVVLSIAGHEFTIYRCQLQRHSTPGVTYYTFTLPRDITSQNRSASPACYKGGELPFTE